MINVNDVSKVFKISRKQKKEMNLKTRDLTAVDRVSFVCKPGRIFTLLGPNGAGKTTMLRMIATMLDPSSGQIEVNGYNTVKKPEMVRKNLGFMSDNTALYDRLTVNELIQYYAELNEMPLHEFKKRKNVLYDLLDMHDFASRRIAKLSSGMKQKTSIVRTMIHNPPVVIFDEPTSGLDVMTSRAIIELIRLCKEEEKTVIFSTHRMGEVQLLSDDLSIIHKGKVFFTGTRSEFETQMVSDSYEDEFIRLTGEPS